MPTFQSIGLHPTLRSRLVTQSSLIPPEASSATELAVSTNPATTAGAPSSSSFASASYYQRVETPHALLVRHPESLRLLEDPATGACRAIGRGEVTKLRQEVAAALISETRSGRHADQVRRALQEGEEEVEGLAMISSSSSPHPETHEARFTERNENAHSNRMDVDDERDNGAEVFKRLEDPQGRPRGPLAHSPAAPDDGFHIPGTLTALELLRYESLRRGRGREQPGATGAVALSTGCPALDELLSLPPEHLDVAGTSAAAAARRGSDGGARPISAPLAAHDQGDRGVPMGCVTQFFGPPASGKTQLALHVAAHRCRSLSLEAGCGTNPATTFPCWFLGPATATQASSHAARLAKLSSNDPAVLNQTFFHPVSNIYQVLSALSSVEETLASSGTPSETFSMKEGGGSPRSTSVCPFPALIILDSASTCCSCADPSSRGSIRLVHQLATLVKRISRQYHAAVIVTNGSISSTNRSSPNDSKTMYPALGRIWEQAVDIQVRIESHPTRSVMQRPNQVLRRATLVRHPTKSIPPEAAPAATFGIDPHSGIHGMLEPSQGRTSW